MRDMTTGRAYTHLWKYALPLLLGNWLQLAYNAIDSIIAGRFIGPEALAAEGIAGPVMNLVILGVSGMCIGSGVLMSEAFGAKDLDKLKATLAMTLSLGVISALVISTFGFIFSANITNLLQVPSEIKEITASYLAITFLGTPFTFIYNTLAAGLKSAGDTKSPLKFLAFSAILNALLDVIFIGFLGFGIICSATTTVVAEGVSAILAIYHICFKEKAICPDISSFKFDKQRIKKIFAYGAPSALQQAIQPICKVLIQGRVNMLGVSSIAAYNAATKLDDFACIPEQGIGSAISTYEAQNRGANKKDRLLKGLKSGLLLEAIYGAIILVFTYLFRKPIISMFVTGESAESVIALGTQYLGYMAFFYILPGLTNGMQGFFRGMGKMKLSALNTFIQASIRTVATFILAPIFGISGIAFSCAIGWGVMLIFMIFKCYFLCKKESLLTIN